MNESPSRRDDLTQDERLSPTTPLSGSGLSVPPLKDVLRPILRPPPGRASAAVRQSLRALFWLGLAFLLLGGLVMPYAAPQLVPIKAQVASAERFKDESYPSGTRLRDCRDPGCPWLVVLPRGDFKLGSPADETGRSVSEGARRKVTIGRSFALMETEVTRGLFAQFIAETNYPTEGGCKWDDPGFPQSDEHPVVCVSWDDARAFARWISKRTGEAYRLPTEAEWEYSARAGQTSSYFFGENEQELCTYGNVADRTFKQKVLGWATGRCSDGYLNTAPVRQFKPNAFGLYDVYGNVEEWTDDCWHATYAGAPTDGSSWDSACSESGRVLRGGGWGSKPIDTRSAARNWAWSNNGSVSIGFRLARTLSSSFNDEASPKRGR